MAILFPHSWPLPWRRAFVLTLPVSGPIWLIAWASWLFGAVLFGLATISMIALAWIITPIITPVFWLANEVRHLWANPPQPHKEEGG